MRIIEIKKSWILAFSLGVGGASSYASARAVPPTNRVSIERARSLATKAFDGKIQGEELEFEGGKWIYSFDLKSAQDRRVHEVHVDAISGKLLDVQTETASDEKKEAVEDAKEGASE